MALVELMRSDLAVAVEVTLIITPLPVKTHGRLTQAYNENLPHISQNLATLSIDFFSTCTSGNGLAQTKGTNVEYCAQARVHWARVGRCLTFRHDFLGHQAILHIDRNSHIPLATIAQNIAQQELNQTAVNRLIRSGNDVGQEPVGAFELIPEEYVALRELEVLDPQAFARPRAQEVQRGKEPAATGLLLRSCLPIIQAV